ncbi:hypothetical protein CDL12_28204 [Handroanthus impetiginosus]|uniref:Response regulatory domain-containing protein n=1 Tax=Handroanthus impetiginosus TaxID=429701 RepID=A0A2G9G1V8_9LAMI|nr:hypothetical protein CDL12_28204 [Handroanthus impetiginosus]
MEDSGSSSSKVKEVIVHEEKPHVLVVDDCSTTRLLNQVMFKTYSCKVTTAENGLKALEFLGLLDASPNLIQVPKVNMIITDYEMPGINGYELLKKIKESSSLKNVPVLIASSAFDRDLIKKCLEAGAQMCLRKPLKLPDVEKLIPLMQ